MSETELLEMYRADKFMLDEYADYVSKIIQESIVKTLKINPNIFFKVPISFRLKTEESLIQKAFYRNKEYKDPYNEITDKIGGRVVVLLEEDANEVCRILEQLSEFTYSKDRDFEIERLKHPELFDYKSHHYILRNKSEIKLRSLVREGTPAEIQIRTLLQHAYSELTHDTIYKPNTVATPEVKRVVAKSMALIEVTDQLFSQVSMSLRQSERQFDRIINDTKLLFPSEVSLQNDNDITNLVLDAYLPEVEVYDYSALKRFVKEFDYIIDNIRERGTSKFLYRQSIILFIYYLVYSKRKIAKAKWPLSPKDLEQIFTDLGFSYERG